MPAPAQLSIIIAAYRSRDEIGPCLDSLPRTLGGRPVEVVVVDNSPGDGAGDCIRRDFPWVQYVPAERNLGFGRANNLGYRHTTGEIILFLNPDTVSNAAALEHCVRRLGAEPGIGLISPRLVRADGAMDLACRRSIPSLWDGFCRACGLAAAFPKVKWFSGYNLTDRPADGTYPVGAINGAFLMGRREVFERVGVFDEAFFMYGDDLDLCIRVGRAGYAVVYDGRQTIVHLKGVSVAREYDRMSQAIFDANRDVFLKHFNPRGSHWVRWKYQLAFGAWKRVSRWRARLRRRRQVQPV
jgi:N-acetylglucosaminyl-diphospho-decaprenol L-rhamnosyltransferase